MMYHGQDEIEQATSSLMGEVIFYRDKYEQLSRRKWRDTRKLKAIEQICLEHRSAEWKLSRIEAILEDKMALDLRK